MAPGDKVIENLDHVGARSTIDFCTRANVGLLEDRVIESDRIVALAEGDRDRALEIDPIDVHTVAAVEHLDTDAGHIAEGGGGPVIDGRVPLCRDNGCTVRRLANGDRIVATVPDDAQKPGCGILQSRYIP